MPCWPKVNREKSPLEQTCSDLRPRPPSLARQALRSRLGTLAEQVENETSKNVEISAELLTLVVQKDKITEEKSGLEHSAQSQAGRVDEAETLLVELRGKLQDTEDALQRERATVEQLRGDKVKAEVELQRALVEFEQQRLKQDKSTADFLREKDAEVWLV